MNKKLLKNILSLLLLFFCLLSIFSLVSADERKLEVEYPTIPEAEKPTEGISVPQYLKYLFNFIVIISGLIGLAVLIWGGIKWSISAGNLTVINEAKKQIWYGFLGLGVILSAYIIIATINPELTFIRFTKKPPVTLQPPLALLPTKEKPKTIIAYEIPLGKLIDGALIEAGYLPEGAAESNAKYGQAQITTETLDEYKKFGDELEGKWKTLAAETNPEEMGKLMQKIQGMPGKYGGYRFRESYFTKIEKVSQKITEIESLSCESGEEDCVLYCEVYWEGAFFGCKVSGMKKLLELITEFEKRKNAEINIVKNELEKAINDIKNILNLDLIEGTSGFSNLSYLDEEYNTSTEDLVNKIVAKTKEIEVIKCCSEEKENELKQKIAELQTITEIFKEGYLIRKDLWEISKQSIAIKKELDNYRTLKEVNLKLVGSDYVYEGVVPSSRLDRILDLDQIMRARSNQIKIVSLTMNTAASVITTLTATCNCIFCGCACGPCVGDPCAPVRPALIAAQAVLAGGAATLPPLSSQLQKEVNKGIKEKGQLQESIEKLTEGLEKAEEMLKSCIGRRNSSQLNLLSLHSFLNYTEELEKYGYQIRVIKAWSDIEIKDDTYTFYCVEGPIVPGITEGSYSLPSSPFGKQKVVCEREIEVGKLIDSTEWVIKGQNQILDQMDETIKSAQKIINEASKNTPKSTSMGTAGDLLQKGIPSEISDKIPREIFRTLSGEQVNEILKDSFKSMPEKYAKDLTQYIFENLPGGKVKNILMNNLGAMSGKDLKGFLDSYFSSLKNEKKKEVSQAIFEGMADSDLKKNILTTFSTIREDNLKEFWSETLERISKEGREQFFESVFDKISEKDLLELYNKLRAGIPAKESRELLKEILKNSSPGISSLILEKYPGQTLEEKIENIPETELKEIEQKTGDSLYQLNSLKRVIQGVPENTLEKVINQIPSGEIRNFTQILFEGLPENSIKQFIFNDILEFDPNFLSRTLNYIPDKEIKDIFLNNIIGSIGGENLKEIVGVANFALTADPKTVLNNLMLKHIPEGVQLMKAADILANQTYDEFLGEVMDVVPGLDGVKDMLDKVSPYIQDIKETINSVLDVVSLTQAQMQGFLGDILNQLPETKLRELAQEVWKYLPSSEIDKIISEVFSQLPADVMRKTINDLLNYTSEEFRQKIAKILETIPDTELPNLLNEVLKNIPKGELNKALESVLSHVPDLKLPDIMNQISKYIPEQLLRNYLNDVFKYLPQNINQVLDTVFNKLPLDSLKKMTDGIFEKLPVGKVNELMNKISSYLPDKMLGQYLDKLTGFVQGKMDEVLKNLQISFPNLPIDLGNLPDVLKSILSGPPCLKQNAKEDIKLPPQFTCGPCGCATGIDCPSICAGMAPPGPYKEVLKRFAYILANNLKINFNQSQLTNTSQVTDNIINIKIKGEIYTSLRNSRVDFGECFARRKISPPMEQQLYKCEDAMNYGWVDQCKDPFNYFCCYPTKE